ncbi:hypothetical protein BCR44DRAFT_77056, partial [Catenaria anguillulae PL171]
MSSNRIPSDPLPAAAAARFFARRRFLTFRSRYRPSSFPALSSPPPFLRTPAATRAAVALSTASAISPSTSSAAMTARNSGRHRTILKRSATLALCLHPLTHTVAAAPNRAFPFPNPSSRKFQYRRIAIALATSNPLDSGFMLQFPNLVFDISILHVQGMESPPFHTIRSHLRHVHKIPGPKLKKKIADAGAQLKAATAAKKGIVGKPVLRKAIPRSTGFGEFKSMNAGFRLAFGATSHGTPLSSSTTAAANAGPGAGVHGAPRPPPPPSAIAGVDLGRFLMFQDSSDDEEVPPPSKIASAGAGVRGVPPPPPPPPPSTFTGADTGSYGVPSLSAAGLIVGTSTFMAPLLPPHGSSLADVEPLGKTLPSPQGTVPASSTSKSGKKAGGMMSICCDVSVDGRFKTNLSKNPKPLSQSLYTGSAHILTDDGKPETIRVVVAVYGAIDVPANIHVDGGSLVNVTSNVTDDFVVVCHERPEVLPADYKDFRPATVSIAGMSTSEAVSWRSFNGQRRHKFSAAVVPRSVPESCESMSIVDCAIRSQILDNSNWVTKDVSFAGAGRLLLDNKNNLIVLMNAFKSQPLPISEDHVADLPTSSSGASPQARVVNRRTA